MIDQYSVTRDLYTTYCASVGGKAFNGDPLPTWEEFYGDSEKQIQVRAWLDVGQRAIDMLVC